MNYCTLYNKYNFLFCAVSEILFYCFLFCLFKKGLKKISFQAKIKDIEKSLDKVNEKLPKIIKAVSISVAKIVTFEFFL